MHSLSFSLSSSLIVLLLIGNSLSGLHQAHSVTHPGDIQVLKLLKDGLRRPSIRPGSCLSSWDFSIDPCDHIFTDRFTCGFRCDLLVSGSSPVTEISLDQAGYSGSISSSSWDLPYLETLDLSYNSLSGPLPNSLSNLTRLRRLSLSKNFFTGQIPTSIGSLSHLQQLCLDNNRLTGRIPPSFSGLIRLNRLELQGNKLSGEFPDLGRLRNLNFIDVSDNGIAGKVPSIFPASLIELSVLDLSHNELSGTIPSLLFDHPSLEQLSLSHNFFSVLRIPDDMSVHSKLIAVDLSHNKLHGLLPAFMASMPELSALSLENNMFTGMIPSNLARKVVVSGSGTASFKRLLLGGNYLLGPIPGPFVGLDPGSVNVSLVVFV